MSDFNRSQENAKSGAEPSFSRVQDVPGRRPWQKLDLLMSQAEKQLSEVDHDDAASLRNSLSYLTELADTVQRELDYAYISLNERYDLDYSSIAYHMGRPWEHDLSHLMIQLHDPELSPGWRAAKRRYVDALKRQFGPQTPVPSIEYADLYRDDIRARSAVIRGEEPPEHARGGQIPDRGMASMKRMNRLVCKLQRRGVLPEGISFSTRFGMGDQGGVVNLHDSEDRIIESIPIGPPRDPAHPLEALDDLVISIARRAQQLIG